MMWMVAAMCVALLAGQSMATTATLTMTDWSCASPLGGWAGVSAGIVAYSGYYYTDVDTVNNYLKFDVSSLNVPGLVVQSAKLTIWTGGQYGPTFSENVYAVASDSWTKTSVTNANKPAFGSLLTTVGWPGDWASFVITPASLAAYVQQEATGDGIVSLGMKAAADCVMQTNMTPRHVWYMGTDPTTWYATTLDVTYIPEPATMTMLGLGALAMLRRRRA